MSDSGLRRRDVLVAVSGGCVTLAGCSDGAADSSKYGAAYGREYGTR